MQTSKEFVDLKKTFRAFAFPMAIASFLWYVCYVLTATFASDFMATPVFGTVNIGFIFGWAQFLTTFIITWIYIKFANKNLEPRAAIIRQKMEG
ncbi:DUF485 domain-containing protein [Corynebacterium sp. sy017]|nr:DUF485 domain-containing protein [Corynebacterium sp. sy017]QDZ43490.1 DUF485 domain-containing protein [Corynebacterium sp. sy039]TSD91504.1 DUF485 domain-containing protein [Corynebacterium sp. SY003]